MQHFQFLICIFLFWVCYTSCTRFTQLVFGEEIIQISRTQDLRCAVRDFPNLISRDFQLKILRDMAIYVCPKIKFGVNRVNQRICKNKLTLLIKYLHKKSLSEKIFLELVINDSKAGLPCMATDHHLPYNLFDFISLWIPYLSTNLSRELLAFAYNVKLKSTEPDNLLTNLLFQKRYSGILLSLEMIHSQSHYFQQKISMLSGRHRKLKITSFLEKTECVINVKKLSDFIIEWLDIVYFKFVQEATLPYYISTLPPLTTKSFLVPLSLSDEVAHTFIDLLNFLDTKALFMNPQEHKYLGELISQLFVIPEAGYALGLLNLDTCIMLLYQLIIRIKRCDEDILYYLDGAYRVPFILSNILTDTFYQDLKAFEPEYVQWRKEVTRGLVDFSNDSNDGDINSETLSLIGSVPLDLASCNMLTGAIETLLKEKTFQWSPSTKFTFSVDLLASTDFKIVKHLITVHLVQSLMTLVDYFGMNRSQANDITLMIIKVTNDHYNQPIVIPACSKRHAMLVRLRRVSQAPTEIHEVSLINSGQGLDNHENIRLEKTLYRGTRDEKKVEVAWRFRPIRTVRIRMPLERLLSYYKYFYSNIEDTRFFYRFPIHLSRVPKFPNPKDPENTILNQLGGTCTTHRFFALFRSYGTAGYIFELKVRTYWIAYVLNALDLAICQTEKFLKEKLSVNLSTCGMAQFQKHAQDHWLILSQVGNVPFLEYLCYGCFLQSILSESISDIRKTLILGEACNPDRQEALSDNLKSIFKKMLAKPKSSIVQTMCVSMSELLEFKDDTKSDGYIFYDYLRANLESTNKASKNPNQFMGYVLELMTNSNLNTYHRLSELLTKEFSTWSKEKWTLVANSVGYVFFHKLLGLNISVHELEKVVDNFRPVFERLDPNKWQMSMDKLEQKLTDDEIETLKEDTCICYFKEDFDEEAMRIQMNLFSNSTLPDIQKIFNRAFPFVSKIDYKKQRSVVITTRADSILFSGYDSDKHFSLKQHLEVLAYVVRLLRGKDSHLANFVLKNPKKTKTVKISTYVDLLTEGDLKLLQHQLKREVSAGKHVLLTCLEKILIKAKQQSLSNRAHYLHSLNKLVQMFTDVNRLESNQFGAVVPAYISSERDLTNDNLRLFMCFLEKLLTFDDGDDLSKDQRTSRQNIVDRIKCTLAE